MNTPTAPAVYPVHVEAELDPGLSRGLWLVKWILALPHYVVLAFLWAAFAVTSVLAFLSILVTGRYPPFTLAEVPDHPAHLEVDYPERLSRGLVLAKWWPLAIPHYQGATEGDRS